MENQTKSFRPRFNYKTKEEKLQYELLIEILKQTPIGEAIAKIRGEEVEKKTEVNILDTEKTDNKLTLKSYSSRLRTEQDVIDFHEIDTKKWKVTNIKTRYWEMGSKLPNGTLAELPLHGIHLTLGLRKEDKAHQLQEFKKEFLKDLKTKIPYNSKKYVSKESDDGLVVELMITDLHLGKIGFDYEKEVYNWSVEDCKKAYFDAINHTLKQLKGKKIKHFVLPTGNDYLNIDSPQNMTTAGTPQMTGVYYEHLYRLGFQMIKEAVLMLNKIAPVHLIFVAGNHDENSTFHYGELAANVFEKFPTVFVNNKLNRRKCHDFGNVAIGYFHFNQVNIKNAGNTFLVDFKEHASKKFKAVHGGHLHKNSKRIIKDIELKEENVGVTIEVCPSLSPNDKWHNDKMFKGNIRSSKTFVWCPVKGLVQEIYFNL